MSSSPAPSPAPAPRPTVATGPGDARSRSPTAAIEAARAGAAIATSTFAIPATGRGLARHRRCTARWSSASAPPTSTWCINLTAGHGRRPRARRRAAPLPLDADGTDMAGAAERLVHVEELLPEICTLDCGTHELRRRRRLRDGQHARPMLRAMAACVQALGVRPELEVFDTGHLVHGEGADPRRPARRSGADPALHGHPVRRARTIPATLLAMVDRLPASAMFSAFSIGRMQLPYVAHGGARRRQRARRP